MKVDEYVFVGMYQNANDKKQYCLITSDGEIINIKSKQLKKTIGLDSVCVVNVGKFAIAEFLTIYKLLAKCGISPKEIRYTSYGGWNFVTDDNITVKLNPDYPESSTKAFLKCDGIKPGSVVDACYPPRVTYNVGADDR